MPHSEPRPARVPVTSTHCPFAAGVVVLLSGADAPVASDGGGPIAKVVDGPLPVAVGASKVIGVAVAPQPATASSDAIAIVAGLSRSTEIMRMEPSM